ncbi:MAG: hypothetical protein ABI460_08780 [Caldimonas sp.]
MKLASIPRLLPVSLAVAALLGAAGAAQAAVGVRVLLQEWNPLTPKQQPVRTLVDDRSAVSDALQAAWTRARPLICRQLTNEMSRGGAAHGETLHDIKCELDETPQFAVATSGPNRLTATVAIGGYVEASSTTPVPLQQGSTDPRFSIALKANLALTLAVQPDPNHTLRVDKAQFSLSNATLDSHNLTGDLLKFVVDDLVPFFGGPNYKQMAENAVNGVAVNLAGEFNSALTPVNAKLRGPSTAVRVGAWGKPDAIVVAFGPRELPAPGGGSMFGALRWDANRVGAPSNCDTFSIDAAVQTGPAPLRDPSGYYEQGDAPMRKVGSFQLQPGSAKGECRYRVNGLAAAWPNEISAHSSVGAGKSAGNSIHSTSYALAGDGWDGKNVVPQPSAERNYVIRVSLNGSATVDPSAQLKHGSVNPGDPRINPADRVGSTVFTPAATRAATLGQAPATLPSGSLASRTARSSMATTPMVTAPIATTLSPLASRSALQRGSAISLNPQPLPPGPDPDAQASTLTAKPVLRWGAAPGLRPQ